MAIPPGLEAGCECVFHRDMQSINSNPHKIRADLKLIYFFKTLTPFLCFFLKPLPFRIFFFG